ncbi:hypothetical protein EDD39_7517 [Kitasatospora cineracea]|uniref:Uncharacterized protein n=1 Tax=Kitasatospora cineracea TaxID=88074 RepID=A0A8G1UFA0_9ACTN|nr:hypothetical protein EDD39_7517 [Kitasatospora cineracea]
MNGATDFTGRQAVVIGGTSGIGHAVARHAGPCTVAFDCSPECGARTSSASPPRPDTGAVDLGGPSRQRAEGPPRRAGRTVRRYGPG